MITPATTTSQDITSSEPKSKPRSGFAQQLLNLALTSPLWDYVLVPQARASIVKTAEGTKICNCVFCSLITGDMLLTVYI